MKKMLCSNCNQPLTEHCKVHLIPCCPGKCEGVRKPKRKPLIRSRQPTLKGNPSPTLDGVRNLGA